MRSSCSSGQILESDPPLHPPSLKRHLLVYLGQDNYLNFIQGRTQKEHWIVGDWNILHSISHYPFMLWQRSRRGQRSQQRVSAAIHCCFS